MLSPPSVSLLVSRITQKLRKRFLAHWWEEPNKCRWGPSFNISTVRTRGLLKFNSEFLESRIKMIWRLQNVSDLRLSNVNIYCSYLSQIIVKWKYLGIGLWLWENCRGFVKHFILKNIYKEHKPPPRSTPYLVMFLNLLWVRPRPSVKYHRNQLRSFSRDPAGRQTNDTFQSQSSDAG